MTTISLIAAMSRNRVIGKDGAMPWHLPADLQRFKSITMGKAMLMGRKTFESLGRLLPGRRHLVLTRNPRFAYQGCDVVHSLDEATTLLGDEPELMVIGGASVYRATLPHARRFYLTLIHTEIDGDVLFPEYDATEWKEVAREERPADDRNPYDLSFIELESLSA
ncbi:MAG: dihydrofolate reductase [Gammaproteobacteria bacterium]